MNNSKIVVVGSSNTDMIIQLDKIPVPGETVIGGEFSSAAGGKGANQAVAAARAGGNVSFVARVGDDMFGRQAIEGFRKDNIDIQNVLTDVAEPSGVALIFVDKVGENSIAVASGANAKLSVEDVERAHNIIGAADVLLMQLETPVETIRSAAKIAKSNNVKVILNPAPAQKLDDELLSSLNVLTPNETEAELLTGIKVDDIESAKKAGEKLLEKGLETVIVTLGSKGALLVTAMETELVPGYKVKAVDATAAGDTFNGILAVGISEGKDMKEAIRLANAGAALSVTKLGAQPSAPDRETIEQFLHSDVERSEEAAVLT
jgi:ribokinase